MISESELQTELNLTRPERRGCPPEIPIDRIAEVRVRDTRPVRVIRVRDCHQIVNIQIITIGIEIDMVEDIEKFRPELDAESLAHSPVLGNGKINDFRPGLPDQSTTEAAELPGSR